MNFREYVPLAMRTNKPKETKLENLLNACLGLVGEYAELSDSLSREEIKDELSDIFWYTALLHYTLETNYDVNYETNTSKSPLISHIGLICDEVKKHAFQGHALSIMNLTNQAEKLLYSLYAQCANLYFTPSEIMEHNVAKLKKRYPAGFEVSKSVNRVEYQEQLSFDDYIGGQLNE